MIINTAPANEAVVSNVGQIGEFRIRNSAKAFNILSSGLYANKIRAIVRELSCNAVDSHTAAGKADVPFDVHLPSQLEPWFSIRDYGTGLSADQVTNIYTTYFESTKTESNEFIGALGLGSKSPFSYTDNFTVTAIKDGKKGIYSAFINEHGVPSIAQMMADDTDEPAGVEVKFSVNDYYDFHKFADEASRVYTYFKLRPVVSGGNGSFQFHDVEYETENIIPGVHSYKDGYRRSVAVMGNISYPIEVPNSESNLGDLAELLRCSLELNFDIGELDFQASREGLSYIPQTIESIKKKLEALNARLATYVAEEADQIENLWERAFFLEEKRSNRLWTSAVNKYVTDTGFKLMEVSGGYPAQTVPFKIKVEDLASRFNITIRSFNKNRGSQTVSTQSAQHGYDRNKKDKDGNYITWIEWSIRVEKASTFIVNDLKVGATERAKHHFRNNGSSTDPYTRTVIVLEAADKNKPVNAKAFFRAIKNPPASMIMNASDLDEKERKSSAGGIAKNVTILSLQSRNSGGYYRSRDKVWRDAGKASDFDDTTTYYYIPLSGFSIVSDRFKDTGGGDLVNMMEGTGLPELNCKVYGVRKGDIEFIKTQANWVNVEDHIKDVLTNITPAQIQSMAMGTAAAYQNLVRYDNEIAKLVTNKKSPYLVVATNVKDAQRIDCNEYQVKELANMFDVTIDLVAAKDKIVAESESVFKRYPLLSSTMSRCDAADVAEYINAIDTIKGI